MNLFHCLSAVSLITCYFSKKIFKFSINYGINYCVTSHVPIVWRSALIFTRCSTGSLFLCVYSKPNLFFMYYMPYFGLQFRSSRQHSIILLTTGSSASALTSQRTSSPNSYSNRVRPFIIKYHIRHVLLPFSINLYGLLSTININFYKLLDHCRPHGCDSFIHSKGIM